MVERRDGMANEGFKQLDIMCNVYKVEPKREHCGCIIDLLIRGGLIEEAKNTIQNMSNLNASSEEAISLESIATCFL